MTKTRRKPHSRRPVKSRPNLRVVVFIAGLGVLIVIGVGVVVLAGRDDPSDDGSAGADPGVAHVHGLGVDPADGTLYVATHHGTFQIDDDGEAERLGDSLQDTMGFTVVGPDHFLGSGHPDVVGMRAGQPGLLGLIESTDRGQSWRSVSLSGEVDFHALAEAHDQIYGWDSTSGRFMVSPDHQSWETRSTVELYAFAVDPGNPDRIVGAGANGPLRSEDGGRSWQPTDGPALVTLSWSETGIWGADPAGAFHHSPDGTTWQSQGALPGPPQAILAHEDALYAATQGSDGTGIHRSDDQGDTWQLIYRDPTP